MPRSGIEPLPAAALSGGAASLSIPIAELIMPREIRPQVARSMKLPAEAEPYYKVEVRNPYCRDNSNLLEAVMGNFDPDSEWSRYDQVDFGLNNAYDNELHVRQLSRKKLREIGLVPAEPRTLPNGILAWVLYRHPRYELTG